MMEHGWYVVPYGLCYDKVDQRIKEKKDKNVLYLEIKRVRNYGTAAFTVQYIASLYPKIKDNPVEISRWNNY